jgi:hypothetical protein
MILTTKTRPPYSLILISDSAAREIPRSLGAGLAAATDSCVAVGCHAEIDGDTLLSLGTLEEIKRPETAVFAGIIFTPNRTVTIRTVTGEILLSMPTSNDYSRIHVWANDRSDPTEIFVGVDQ